MLANCTPILGEPEEVILFAAQNAFFLVYFANVPFVHLIIIQIGFTANAIVTCVVFPRVPFSTCLMKKTHQKPIKNHDFELCFYSFQPILQTQHLVDITIVQASLPHLMDNFLLAKGSPAGQMTWLEKITLPPWVRFSFAWAKGKGQEAYESSFCLTFLISILAVPSPYVVME